MWGTCERVRCDVWGPRTFDKWFASSCTAQFSLVWPGRRRKWSLCGSGRAHNLLITVEFIVKYSGPMFDGGRQGEGIYKVFYTNTYIKEVTGDCNAAGDWKSLYVYRAFAWKGFCSALSGEIVYDVMLSCTKQKYFALNRNWLCQYVTKELGTLYYCFISTIRDDCVTERLKIATMHKPVIFEDDDEL